MPKANKEPKTSSQQGQITGRETAARTREHGSMRLKRNWPHNEGEDSTQPEKTPWKFLSVQKWNYCKFAGNAEQHTHTKKRNKGNYRFFLWAKMSRQVEGKKKSSGLIFRWTFNLTRHQGNALLTEIEKQWERHLEGKTIPLDAKLYM